MFILTSIKCIKIRQQDDSMIEVLLRISLRGEIGEQAAIGPNLTTQWIIVVISRKVFSKVKGVSAVLRLI